MRHNLAFMFLLASALPAAAQLVLPGAVAPTPQGATVSAPNGAAPNGPAPNGPAPNGRPKLRPAERGEPAAPPGAPVKAPPVASLAGQILYLDGRKSTISFELRDKRLEVTHLTLTGEKISNPQDQCAIEIADAPIPVSEIGQPNGVSQIKLDLPACPMAFDVLDGAVLSVGDTAVCPFKAADCNVHPAGLWGPQPSTLGPDQAKLIERARTKAEASVRANFKRLLALTKDRPTVMSYARQQAGFSSLREELCRDYSGESRHGFCSTRLTEARAAALHAQAEAAAAAKALRKKGRQKS